MVEPAATIPLAAEGPERQRTIRALAKCIPDECYENPTAKGLLYLGRDLALYGVAVWLLLTTTSVPLVLAGWLLASFTIAGLFVIGHDAAHGALFKNARLNYLAGQLAMLPSLHVSSVWAYGHNRVHHAFPGCEGLDFVWHPVTIEEYRALSWWKRLRHRLDWSFLGAGTYYARAIWWERLMRMPAPERMAAPFRRDRLVVVAYLMASSALVAWAGWEQTGTTAGAAWTWAKVLLVPWLVWNVLIGWAVYIQHISPGMAWHSRRRWRKFAGQVETTSNFHMPRWLNFFWHNILVHVPHHVDPRIPFYNLPAAADALTQGHADVGDSLPYYFSDYLETTRRCKLYDFDRETWTGYDGDRSGAASTGPSAAA